MTTSSTPEIRWLDPEGTLARAGELERVAVAAFGALPLEHGQGVAERLAPMLPAEVRAGGFRCVTVQAPGGSSQGRLLGFALGYTTPDPLPDDPWYVQLGRCVGAGGLPHVAGRFSLVWLAVHPEAQGHGLGRRLHDAVLEGIEHAWLVTSEGETAGWALYRRAGWRVIGRGGLGPAGRERVVLAR